MSAKLLNFAGSPHDETTRLLPWLVNGTLDTADQALVEAHLQECQACQSELQTLRDTRAACSIGQGEPLPAPAFARLRGRVGVGPRAAVSLPLRARLHGWSRGWYDAPAWLQGLVIVQACALVALVAGPWLVTAVSPPAQYRTLSSSMPAMSGVHGDATLLLMLAPTLDQAESQRLLLRSGARIIDGPSHNGAYVVAVDARHAAVALETLRASRGVRVAELIGDGARE